MMLKITGREIRATIGWLLLLSVAALAQQSAARSSGVTLTRAEQQAAAQLQIKTLREVTVALTAREMEGRGTGQPGADRAAQYLAERFRRAGLRPGAPNGWLQPAEFKVEAVLQESSFRAGDTTFKFKQDFVLAPPLPAQSVEANGNLVFVGYGVVSDELKRDDLAGIDVKGKIAVVLSGRPKNVDEKVWAKAAGQQVVFGRLISKGATGFVVIFEGRETQPFSLVASYLSRRRVSLADAPGMPFKIPPVVLIGDSAAGRIPAGQNQNLEQLRKQAESGEFVSRDLNLPASISAQIKRETARSSNVIGVLEGSDPKLKSEAVVYTAHYDAYGIDQDGTIYTGAGDNAIGTAKLVAIAEVMAKMKPKPRRSVVFIALTGEEYGLLGAEYWVKNPTWLLEKVAANINYDGIGTDAWGPLGFLIDLGYVHSDLHELIKDVAAAHKVGIVPDSAPEEGFFYRSDNYVFFKRGIPSVYLIGGPEGNPTETMGRAMKWLTTTYHMAGDTVQPDWNWSGAQKLTAIGLITGLRIANQDAMPAWKSDSPYNRPRGTTLPPPPRQ